MKTCVIIDVRREGYTPEDCGKTMTVAELRDYLEDFDEDSPVYVASDNRYTYGAVRSGRISEDEFEFGDEDGYDED